MVVIILQRIIISQLLQLAMILLCITFIQQGNHAWALMATDSTTRRYHHLHFTHQNHITFRRKKKQYHKAKHLTIDAFQLQMVQVQSTEETYNYSDTTTIIKSNNNNNIDWKLYTLQQQYKKSGGILYKTSILTPHEYTTIMSSLSSLNLLMEDENVDRSFATNRVGACIARGEESSASDASNVIYDLLGCGDGSLCALVNSLADHDDDDKREDNDDLGKLVLAPDIPIEVRVYEKTGAGMEWHIDDILYNPPQIEIVLTLENNSDCCTIWRPHDKLIRNDSNDSIDDQNTRKYDVQSTQTTPNSALILKAGGVEHKVSPLTTGKRTILKMAFVREGATMVSGMEGHTTHHHEKKRQKNKDGQRKKNGRGVNSRKNKR